MGDETALYADAAYSSKETRDKLERFGSADQVQRKGYRNKPLSAKDRRRNDAIAVIRAGGEWPFATYKSRYGLARARFVGLAKNRTAYGIAAIAHNLRKGANFLTLYSQPDPNYARQLRLKPRNGTTNQAKLSISKCKIRKQLI